MLNVMVLKQVNLDVITFLGDTFYLNNVSSYNVAYVF